ncbi:post-segregation antitoxin CcdA [Sandaracinobacter neustonicus]|uniref:Post-segregation antitoxin CcdA n=1 Tax=Sandaracinobacter neustonicus TaxID=1715348 RepID=A0A501XG32_9SPHN|nr:type II toxin-antitoxin system CcdA family antitoxin [Sandaracinobacter neustonicus]TPE59588.1 post-segregation antitoxin CcdA [Sandaracinobacter neustonicus]
MNLALARKPTNLSLPAELVAEARALEVNISRACEEGLERQVAAARRARWLAENRAALDSSNDWADANGLPLAAQRLF